MGVYSERFGEIRAAMQQRELDEVRRVRLYEALRGAEASAPERYREEVLGYLREFPWHWGLGDETPLDAWRSEPVYRPVERCAVRACDVCGLDEWVEAHRLVPFAMFTLWWPHADTKRGMELKRHELLASVRELMWGHQLSDGVELGEFGPLAGFLLRRWMPGLISLHTISFEQITTNESLRILWSQSVDVPENVPQVLLFHGHYYAPEAFTQICTIGLFRHIKHLGLHGAKCSRRHVARLLHHDFSRLQRVDFRWSTDEGRVTEVARRQLEALGLTVVVGPENLLPDSPRLTPNSPGFTPNIPRRRGPQPPKIHSGDGKPCKDDV